MYSLFLVFLSLLKFFAPSAPFRNCQSHLDNELRLLQKHSREPAALPTGWFDVLECVTARSWSLISITERLKIRECLEALIKDLDQPLPLTPVQRLYCYGWFSLLISALREQIEQSGEVSPALSLHRRFVPDHDCLAQRWTCSSCEYSPHSDTILLLNKINELVCPLLAGGRSHQLEEAH